MIRHVPQSQTFQRMYLARFSTCLMGTCLTTAPGSWPILSRRGGIFIAYQKKALHIKNLRALFTVAGGFEGQEILMA